MVFRTSFFGDQQVAGTFDDEHSDSPIIMLRACGMPRPESMPNLDGMSGVCGRDVQAGQALMYAVARNNIEAVRSLLKGNAALADFSDYDKRTPLHVAASEGHRAIVMCLLASGATPSRTDRWGGSALDDALRHCHQELAQLLRAQGAQLGMSAEQAATKLISAASAGNTQQACIHNDPLVSTLV